MEMRPFDRSSRDPATLKKPRLVTDETPPFLRGNNSSTTTTVPNGAGRPLVQRQQLVLGFRSTDKDSESNGAGGGYQPQALSQLQLQQQHQELVNQYRTALAELTFNSKPIITNLTIIAGENVHAAKAVSATICNNILEVPSDQKLPSLYLLDSIVKNIGRDYIKYFAARLPEVFCKAYRQIDPAVHSGMRHLFGTWKGVFPPQSLQLIEKELGFQSTANGSSSGLTTSRLEPQPQRPGRSIHVNPKYLEARERLQQSIVAKGPTSHTNLIKSPEDTERPDRTTPIITSSRPRADPRFKSIQQAQRDLQSASIRENDGAPINDFDYGSDAGFGKSSETVADPGSDSSWSGPGSNRTETISGLRNGSDINCGFPNLSVLSSTSADIKLQSPNNIARRRGSEVNRSWKNSEEEEYTWDGTKSRLANSVKSFSSSKRDPRSHPEPEKLGFENRLQKPERVQDVGSRVDREALLDSLFGEHQDSGLIRQQMPSVRSQGLSLGSSVNGVSTSVNILSKPSLQPQIGSSHIRAPGLGFPPSAITGQQRHTPGAASLPVHRPPAPSFPSNNSNKMLHNLADQDRTAQSRGQKNTGLSNQSSQDSLPISNSQKPQVRNSILPLHTKKHEPSQSPTTKNSVDANTSVGSSSSDNPKSPAVDVPTPSSSGNLLAAVSNIFGNNFESNSRAPLRDGPLPTQVISSGSTAVPSHLSPSTHFSISLSASTLKREADIPSLPPVSSLLSTLVAKGLISISKADSPCELTVKTDPSPKLDNPALQAVPTLSPRSMKIPLKRDDPSVSNSASTITVPPLTSEDIKSVIGFEFKPDVIRRSHPTVISELIIDDLPHQCHICGLRFKLHERFDRHVEWHTLRNSELNTLNNASRRWFTKSDDWVKEKPEIQSSNQVTGPVEIDGELMLVADESQCVCVLCGEVFDDFYSREMDKWMFRSAVYLRVEDGEGGNIGVNHGPVVHARCISESSLSDLGLSNGVKREKWE